MNRALKIILVFWGLLFIVGCSSNTKGNNKKPQTKKMKIASVKVLVMKPKKLKQSITVSGTVDTRYRSMISAPIEGSLTKLTVREGDKVYPGKIVGYITSVNQQNMLAQAKSEYEIEKVRGTEETKTASLQRLESAKKLFRPTPLVASSRGIVLTRFLETGAFVQPRQHILEIADVSNLIVKSAVPERYIAHVTRGKKVRISLPAFGDSILIGKVRLIYPSADIKTRTVGIEIALPKHKLLRPGMTATCIIVTQAKGNIVAVPQDAIVINPHGDKSVFVYHDGKAEKKSVKTGMETNTLAEIITGITLGDSVIVAGHTSLKNGAKVNVVGKPSNKKDSKK